MNYSDFCMSESSLDLFCEHAEQAAADAFALECEQKAAELEITVDYYMAEFL